MVVPVSPAVPTESSTAAPVGGFSSWFKNIGDWAKALSPAGATSYETDWADLTLNTGYVMHTIKPQWKRIGTRFYFRGAIAPAGGGSFATDTAHFLTAPVVELSTVSSLSSLRPAAGNSTDDMARIYLASGAVTITVKAGHSVTYVSLAALSGTPL